MGTKEEVGYDWGVYLQLYKRPNETGRLAVTGKTKNTGAENVSRKPSSRKGKRNTA